MPRVAAPRPQIVDILDALRNEPVAVGHLDLRQAGRVNDLTFGNDFVLIQNESRQRVDVARAKRTLLLRWHGSIDVIVNRCGKWPVIRKRPRRRGDGERASASDQPRSKLAALASRTVARRAFIRKNLRALFGRAASWRKLFPFRADRVVPGLDLILTRSLPDAAVSR